MGENLRVDHPPEPRPNRDQFGVRSRRLVSTHVLSAIAPNSCAATKLQRRRPSARTAGKDS